MDFLRDIRQIVLSTLPCMASARRELEAKDTRELLIIFRNWQERLIQPVPRQVHWSRALLANKFTRDERFSSALKQIAKTLELGGDVTPHLSRNIIHGYQSGCKDGRRRRDLDLMLNDWGVHHLHLSAEVEADGFVRRSGPLLFVVVRNHDVYLVDIMDHGNWTSRHIFKVMAEEWPEANLAHEVKGASGLAREVSEADHAVLRRNYVNSAVEIGDKVFMPVRGLTSAGSSVAATMAVNRLMDEIEYWENYIKINPDFFPGIIREEGVEPPPELDLHFLFFDAGGFGVVEKQTGVAFRLGY